MTWELELTGGFWFESGLSITPWGEICFQLDLSITGNKWWILSLPFETDDVEEILFTFGGNESEIIGDDIDMLPLCRDEVAWGAAKKAKGLFEKFGIELLVNEETEDGWDKSWFKFETDENCELPSNNEGDDKEELFGGNTVVFNKATGYSKLKTSKFNGSSFPGLLLITSERKPGSISSKLKFLFFSKSVKAKWRSSCKLRMWEKICAASIPKTCLRIRPSMPTGAAPSS